MDTHIHISEPGLADIPTLISILMQATQHDPIFDYIFPGSSTLRSRATERMRSAYIAQCTYMMSNPSQSGHPRFAMAVDTSVKETVGWVLIFDGAMSTTPPSTAQPPDFLTYYQTQLNRDHAEIFLSHDLERTEYMFLQALYVLPSRQRRGIGTRLVRWIYHTHNLDLACVYLQTPSWAQRFYERLGWIDAGRTDLDLGRWRAWLEGKALAVGQGGGNELRGAEHGDGLVEIDQGRESERNEGGDEARLDQYGVVHMLKLPSGSQSAHAD